MRIQNYAHSRLATSAIVIVFALAGFMAFAEGQAEETGEVEQDLVIAMQSDIVSLDPHGSNDSPSSNVSSKIYDNLVSQNTDMEIVPELAVDWTPVDDVTWEFELREDVTFHNGEEFTAEAVKMSLERVIDPDMASQRAFLFEMITEVRAVDDYTVEIETEYPFAPLLSHLAHDGGGIIAPSAIEEAGYDEVEPIGTGPFTLNEWDAGNEIVLDRNDDYWGTPANVETVTFQVVPEESTRLAMVERGDAHVAEIMQPASMGRVESSNAMNLELYDSLSLNYIGYNVEKEPYDDVRVRQAISMAIDKEGMVEGIVEGAGTVADGPISNQVFGFHPDLDSLSYDPERAEELLEEAGYEDGFETTIWTNDNPTRIEIAEIVQNQLAEVNIDASIDVLEWGAYLDGTAEGNHDMFILGWVTVTGDADYGTYALFHSDMHGAPGNRSFYTNEDVDELLDEARTETDPEVREDLYHEVQEYLVEEAPMLYLYHPQWMIALADGVEGYSHHPNNNMLLMDVTINQ